MLMIYDEYNNPNNKVYLCFALLPALFTVFLSVCLTAVDMSWLLLLCLFIWRHSTVQWQYNMSALRLICDANLADLERSDGAMLSYEADLLPALIAAKTGVADQKRIHTAQAIDLNSAGEGRRVQIQQCLGLGGRMGEPPLSLSLFCSISPGVVFVVSCLWISWFLFAALFAILWVSATFCLFLRDATWLVLFSQKDYLYLLMRVPFGSNPQDEEMSIS